MKESLVLRLRNSNSNVVGIKDSEGSLNKIMNYRIKLGNDFIVMTGTDSLIAPAIMMGSDGVVSAIADVAPEFCVKLFNFAFDGDIKNAKRLQYDMLKIREITKSFSDSRAVLKYILYQRKIFSSYRVRRPLKELSDEEKKKLSRILIIRENGDFEIHTA